MKDFLFKGTSKNLKTLVAPAKAGAQSIVKTMSYEGLDSGLRRNDG
jgi:hypothetical protein